MDLVVMSLHDGVPSVSVCCFLYPAQPGRCFGGFYLSFCRVFLCKWQLLNVNSHQVNSEMENNYSIFIVNYVYCFCTGTVSILLKLQLNLQCEAEFSLLSTHVWGSFLSFLGGFTQKNQLGYFLVSTRISEPCLYVGTGDGEPV